MFVKTLKKEGRKLRIQIKKAMSFFKKLRFLVDELKHLKSGIEGGLNDL